MNKLASVLLLCGTLLLTACSGGDVQQYRSLQPAFAPEQFFQGALTAHGVLKNRRGDVTRTFHATIDASWHNGTGTLAERFVFNDGEIQYRTWTLRPQGDGRYLATAGDVIGEGGAQVAGNAFHLEYTLQVQYRGKPLALKVDDWMFRLNEQVVINRSTLHKWGWQVGSIELVILKQ